MNTNGAIKLFIQKYLDFDLLIREKKGFDDASLNELITLLIKIKENLIHSDSIPKELAEIFLDVWGALTSSADLYEESKKNQIYEAADLLCYHARNICTS